MNNPPRHRPLPALAVLLAAGLTAQDPPAPPGGFPVAEVLDQLVTYADGYRTRADLRLPDPVQITPPASGWPCVMIVHATNAGRGSVAASATEYASRGYVTLVYDVRGQAEAAALNTTGGTTSIGRLEKGDMVEQFHWAEATLGPAMDFDRLSVRGPSQGALHAWAAAAWSGQPLPQPRGPHTHFPRIAAATPEGLAPDFAGFVAPQGTAFGARHVKRFFTRTPVQEEAFRATGRAAFLNQDFAAWAALFAGPWRQDAQLFRSSAVPVFVHASYDDWWMPPNQTVDALLSLPASTPWAVHLGTDEHGTPDNLLELAVWDDSEKRWLDHFLKGTVDEIAQQPRFRLSTMPDLPAAYSNPETTWQLRWMHTYPDPSRVVPRTLFLRDGGALSEQRPTAAEARETIDHRVPQGYGPWQWLQTANAPVLVLRDIPLAQAVYLAPPFAQDEELLGRPQATIEIDSAAPDLQIHVALFDQAPAGSRRYVTAGFRALRGRSPGASSHDVELGDLSYVFRAGHRPVLIVENHVYHRPPGFSEMRTVPYFASYRFDAVHDPARASHVVLPLLPRPSFGARAGTTALSAAAGGTVPVPLDGSGRRAGQAYATLINASGTVPGFRLLGAWLPINWDSLAAAGLGTGGAAPFVGFTGVLDATGAAAPRLVLGPGILPPSAAGMLLSFAAVTLEPSGALAASAASQVWIQP